MFTRPRSPRSAALALLAAAVFSPACATHRTATEWHGHVGADGQPVFVQTSVYWGVNFFVAMPLTGETSIDGMVADATAQIDLQDGSCLRVVETETSNYWWSVPPLSWVLSPIYTSISIEYRPSPQAVARAAARRRGGDAATDTASPSPSR